MGSRRSTRLAVQPQHRQAQQEETIEEDDNDHPMGMSDEETQSISSGRKQYDSGEDDYEENGTAKSRKATGRGGAGTSRSEASGNKKKHRKPMGTGGGISDLGVVFTQEEMLKNSLLYLLLLQHKKVPAKKSDIVKYAMNGQAREFEEVFKELAVVLNHVFGMNVLGVGTTQKSGLFSNYMLVSNYNLSVCDMVAPRDHDVDTRRSILFLILSTIFMLNRNIDEDLIWKIMVDAKFNTLICERRESLRKFLRDEYVSTMYLEMEENKDNDPPTVRYSWGGRADREFSKYSILKFVTKQFPGKKAADFTIQYGICKETEGDQVAADAAVEALEADDDEAENIPPEDDGEMVVEDEGMLGQADDEHAPEITNSDEDDDERIQQEASDTESDQEKP